VADNQPLLGIGSALQRVVDAARNPATRDAAKVAWSRVQQAYAVATAAEEGFNRPPQSIEDVVRFFDRFIGPQANRSFKAPPFNAGGEAEANNEGDSGVTMPPVWIRDP